MKDFEGKDLQIGDDVLFSASIYDTVHNLLRRGVVAENNFGIKPVCVRYQDRWHEYNPATGKHDIPVTKVCTDWVEEHSVYKI